MKPTNSAYRPYAIGKIYLGLIAETKVFNLIVFFGELELM